jgi:hypothetical protein
LPYPSSTSKHRAPFRDPTVLEILKPEMGPLECFKIARSFWHS